MMRSSTASHEHGDRVVKSRIILLDEGLILFLRGLYLLHKIVDYRQGFYRNSRANVNLGDVPASDIMNQFSDKSQIRNDGATHTGCSHHNPWWCFPINHQPESQQGENKVRDRENSAGPDRVIEGG